MIVKDIYLADIYQYVEYNQVGLPARRPILTGSNAYKTFDEIPLVDMTNLASSFIEERKAVAAEVIKVCSEVGFFYAQNHPVPQEVIDETFEALAKFFSQPNEVLAESHTKKTNNFRGFEQLFETKYDTKTRGDMRESFLIRANETDGDQDLPFSPDTDKPSANIWPRNNPEFRRILTRYHSHLNKFSKQLIRIFALSLDLPEKDFDDLNQFPMGFMRPSHYPPQEVANGGEPGIAAHTDFGCFAVLCQDKVEALEVLNKNSIWIPAPPLPRTFIINIAGLMQFLTNGRFT